MSAFSRFDEAISELMARDIAAFGADPSNQNESRKAARAAFWDAEVVETNLERAMQIATGMEDA